MACKVGPSVTAAAAKAAIAALCDEASCPKDIFETTGDSAVYRFDSPTPLTLASLVVSKSNLITILRADGDKDTSDMEEQQEDKGNYCIMIQSVVPNLEWKARNFIGL